MNEPTRTAWEFILEETAEANRSNTRLRNRLTGPERLCGRGRSNPVSRNRQFLASNVSHSLLPAGRDCACRGAGDRRRVHRHTTTMHAHHDSSEVRAGRVIGGSIGRFGFRQSHRPNRKSPHGGGGLVDLVDLVNLFRGSTCVACSPAHKRAPLLPSLLTEPAKSTNSTKSVRSGAFFIWSMCEPPTKQETKSGVGRDE